MQVLSDMRRDEVVRLRNFAEANGAGFQDWILELLVKTEGLAASYAKEASRLQGLPFRVLQVAYATLLCEGDALSLSNVVSDAQRSACRDLYASISDICGVSGLLALGRRGLNIYQLREGSVVQSRTAIDDALFEFAQNVAVAQEDVSDYLAGVLDSRVAEAEKVMFGRRLADLVNLPAIDSALLTADDLIAIDLSRTGYADRWFIDHLTLTHSRLARFEAPYFLDLGIAAGEVRGSNELIAAAGEMNWLCYYPFLQARGIGQTAPGVAVTTPRLIGTAMTVAGGTKAFRLHRLSARAKEASDADGRYLVEALTRRVHHAFEEEVARALQSLGLQALASVAGIDGQDLPCGEIDVVAGGFGVDRVPIFFVCEAKNVDMPLWKDHAYDHAAETMGKAARQVSTKGGWVRDSWQRITKLLNLPVASPPLVVGLIATRETVPLPLLAGWPGGTVGEVRSAVGHALSVPHADWRSDLSSGLLGQGAA